MKYLYYMMVLMLTIVRRLVFPLVIIAISLRAKLRSIVYNYHLQNGKFLKRLNQRTPRFKGSFWELDGTRHSILLKGKVKYTEKGIVAKESVSKFKYYITLPLWLLLDDDCNDDTYDKWFDKTIIDKEIKPWMPKFIVNKLQEDYDKADSLPYSW